jgi:hypothetical protein
VNTMLDNTMKKLDRVDRARSSLDCKLFPIRQGGLYRVKPHWSSQVNMLDQ